MDKNALRTLSYGLYIVSSFKDGKLNGQIANTVIQTTSKPYTIAVSINKENFTHECMKASGAFSVSVLSTGAAMKLIGTFGFRCGRDIDKFENLNYTTGATGAPIVLDGALAWLEAKIICSIELSTHTIFVGEVVGAEVIAKGDPMTYAYYHDVKGGKTPQRAASFIEETGKAGPEKEKAASRYVCSICGYTYDPEAGDPEHGVAPGTSFEDLPADWTCPICGAAKDKFDRE